MVAFYFFQKLVISARVFMKKASWGCCVLVLDLSGELTNHPESSDTCALGFFGNEFNIGRTKSCDEGIGATVDAPMDYESSINCFNFVLGEICVVFHLFCFPGQAEVPVVAFGEGDISTEPETKKQRRSRSGRRSWRLVPLVQSASAPIDFSSRDLSRTLLEQAFDYGLYQMNWGFS